MAALRTVLAPALAEPQNTSQSRPGALPRPLKSSRWRARCPLRDPKPSAAYTSCVLLAVRHPRCGRRGDEPLGTLCRVFRAAELCGAGRMLSAVGGSQRKLRFLGDRFKACGFAPTPPLRGCCCTFAGCGRFRLLAPLRVTVVAALPPRSLRSLSYPSGTHNTWQPNTNSEITSSQLTVSIRLRAAVD